MKKIFVFLFASIVAAGAMQSCHKVDVVSNSEYTPAVFPTTEAQFQSVIGPIYTHLRNIYQGDQLTFSLSTDESILPAYGGNWYDGNKYQELHRHTWTKDNPWVNSTYSDAAYLVGLANQTLYILKDAPDGAAKSSGIAEVKAMRALGFFMLMDGYGGVPLDTLYGVTELKARATRTEVFNYIESELKSILPNLKTASGATTYGKPTRYFAFSLLAKMYLNAEVYTGTARLNACIAACDSVMNAGGGSQYVVEPRSSYLSMFYPTNGPSMKEFIFAIPFDGATSSGYYFPARYDLNRNLGIRYKYSGSTAGNNVDPIMNGTSGNGLVNSKPSGPRATLSTFLNYFLSDPNDIRLGQWLYGPQYWPDGNPIMVRTTKKGYDQFYTGSDGSTSIDYALVLDTSIKLRQNDALFDCGNDEIAWNQGARNIKFLADYTNTASRNQGNDVPLFRISDIILMKAEAILRGGTATNGHTAVSLVNMIRSKRSTSAAWTTVTLEDIYQERSRELAWEFWHRNDMIRFGKYETIYGFKSNTDTYRRLYPIPTVALSANPKLTQNPGY